MLKVKVVDKINRKVQFYDEFWDFRMIVFVPIDKKESIRVIWTEGYMIPAIKNNLNKYYAQASAIINETKKPKIKNSKNQLTMF